ncbi:hypothetical protein [Hyphomicrobium nitrativorans]|nr:hypothetical protein [Hyphomicrobium nitrativorans]
MTAALLRHFGCDEHAHLIGDPFLPRPGRTIKEIIAMTTEKKVQAPTPIAAKSPLDEFMEQYGRRCDQILAGMKSLEEGLDTAPRKRKRGVASRSTGAEWKAAVKAFQAAKEDQRMQLAAEAPAPFWLTPDVDWSAIPAVLRYMALKWDAEADEFFRDHAPLKPFMQAARARGISLSDYIREFVELESTLRSDPERGMIMMLEKEARASGIPPEQFRPWAAQRMAQASQACLRMTPQLWQGSR